MRDSVTEVEMVRFFAKKDGALLAIVHNGGQTNFPISRERLLRAIESAVEALREIDYGKD